MKCLFALLAAAFLSGCYEETVYERQSYGRRYVTYAPDRDYYHVHYREAHPRPYYRRVYYDDGPRHYRGDRRYYYGRRYREPGSRIRVSF